jgi:XTP/dITP diphosphohydrolase
MPVLVLGTRNRKKVEELSDLLRDLPLTAVDLSAFPDAPEIEETGKTFEENARLKAVGVSSAIKQWVLAEDSGLVVPALGDEPGVDSALYAGTHGDDRANNKKLLEKIGCVPEDRRDAYYVCVAVLANPAGEVVAMTEGRCHGVIAGAPQGSSGFGYDPLFLVPEFHKTFGELSLRVKQALSHRARAIGQIRPVLWKIT